MTSRWVGSLSTLASCSLTSTKFSEHTAVGQTPALYKMKELDVFFVFETPIRKAPKKALSYLDVAFQKRSCSRLDSHGKKSCRFLRSREER